MSYLRVKLPVLIFLIAFIPSVVLAQGGPPLITDDPGTPGPGKWEINIAMSGGRDDHVTLYALPDIDVNYGIGDNIQIKVGLPWEFRESEEGGHQNGFGNPGVGVKWRFLDECRTGVSMSVYPQYDSHTIRSSAVEGLADKGFELFLPVEIGKTFGKFDVSLEAGYNIQEDHRNQAIVGVAGGWNFSEKADVVGEVRDTNDIRSNSVIAQIGTHWNFYKFYTLLFSVGRELKGEANILSYLGLRLNL